MCYSFWVLSVLSILNKITWIDADKLISFILSAQDLELGGIADRPGDMPDVFHTIFGLAGKAILTHVLQNDLTVPPRSVLARISWLDGPGSSVLYAWQTYRGKRSKERVEGFTTCAA